MTGDPPHRSERNPTHARNSDRAPARPEVVVVGSAETIDKLADRLVDCGCAIAREPIIQLRANTDGALESAVDRLRAGAVDWLVFLSRPAATFLTERLVAAGTTAPAVVARPSTAPTRVAVVGAGTAEVARALNWPVDLVAPDSTAAGLVRALATHPGINGASVLLPRSAVADDAVLDPLRAAGANVTVVAAYDNHAAAIDADAWRERVNLVEDLIIVFLSSSSVDALHQRLSEPDPPILIDRTRMIAIGPSTAATIESHDWPVTAIAEPHTIDGVVEAVARMLGNTGSP